MSLSRSLWPCFVAVVVAFWLYLVITGTGFSLFEEYWLYSVMMVFGSAIAGFTPEGGGAVAFPVLSLYFKITPMAARDFSLAIQSIGMVSTAIWILTRKGYNLVTFKWVPFYALMNFFGFVVISQVYSLFDFRVIQMLFVSLALSFILSYLISRGAGKNDVVDVDDGSKLLVFSVAAFLGGCASGMFGTGADMLIYIAMTCFYGLKEKISTDISIVVMAIMSVLGIAWRGLILDSIQPEVFNMWLATVPIVVFFAPLGNILLAKLKKEVMLFTVLLLNAVNFAYFLFKNDALVIHTLFAFFAMLGLFMIRHILSRRRLLNSEKLDMVNQKY